MKVATPSGARVAGWALVAGLAIGAVARAEEVPARQGFQSEVVHRLDTHLGKNLVALAGAIPEGSWEWRPSDEVRTVAGVVKHAASANYWFGVQMGAERPDDLPKWSELNGKAELVEALERSFGFARQAVLELSDEELEGRLEFFGEQITIRELTLNMITHGSEHLGQLIAYARAVGVVPPWSADG